MLRCVAEVKKVEIATRYKIFKQLVTTWLRSLPKEARCYVFVRLFFCTIFYWCNDMFQLLIQFSLPEVVMQRTPNEAQM